jgi:hypothetical protein
MHFADTTITRGAPSFASFAKCGSFELHDIRIPSFFQPLLCHPERSKIVRSRTILCSRGTCFLPMLGSNHPAASPSRGQTAGLSIPGANSRASPFPPGAGPCFHHTQNAGALPFSRSLREGGAFDRRQNRDFGWPFSTPTGPSCTTAKSRLCGSGSRCRPA